MAEGNANGKAFKYFQHTVANTHRQFGEQIVTHARTKKDTYFALAAYKQGFHPKPKAPTKKQIRVRDNVAELKALWLDIDFKDGYSSPHEAAAALKALPCPAPSILVHSGNGIHAYWPLKQPIPLDRWQGLAEGLKQAAKDAGVHADLACTADACRVLRPPGTVNWKDPANPKRVKVLYSSGRLFDEDELGVVPVVSNVPASMLDSSVYNEFTGGTGSRGKSEPATMQEIIKHCSVSRHLAETQGKESSEPEWVAMLQLLKHCTDADLWVHEVSKGHPGYDPQATAEKWQQRLENDAGPTLCKTFEDYFPEKCKNCPHHGFIKSPIQKGVEGTQVVGGLPKLWRTVNGNTERMMKDTETGQFIWVKVLSHEFANFRTSRSISTWETEHRIDVPGVIMDLSIPGGCLGNSSRLIEHMALYGVAFKGKEATAFKDLMTTWLKELQDTKRVAEVTEQLGWMEKEGKTVGFSCGPTTFYADGRVRNDVRTAKEFGAVAKHYEPKGEMDKWKEVAAFLSTQNNPAFTALIASAFAAPILRFTGVSGAILSIVSAESGVGKTSALKAAQSVWGSPTHGVNAIDDTPKSVARKLGFLNNLPAYWDELRGQNTVEEFLTLAFQVSQGKEKTRLDQSATLREIHTWETMLIVASNDSIFEAMGQYSIGSDAGVARTFEIVVEPFKCETSRAKVAILFEQLNTNYGHAGRAYAQYLATNQKQVAERVQVMRGKLEGKLDERGAERFWFSMMASLIVGAQIAGELGLMQINVKTLAAYLAENLVRLRGRSVQSMSSSEPAEVLAMYMQAHQDKILYVDKFPLHRQNKRHYMPQIIASPKTDKIICHVARDEKRVRFSEADFKRWLNARKMNSHNVLAGFNKDLDAKEVRTMLGFGTKYEIPTQKIVECDITSSYEDVV